MLPIDEDVKVCLQASQLLQWWDAYSIMNTEVNLPPVKETECVLFTAILNALYSARRTCRAISRHTKKLQKSASECTNFERVAKFGTLLLSWPCTVLKLLTLLHERKMSR